MSSRQPKIPATVTVITGHLAFYPERVDSIEQS